MGLAEIDWAVRTLSVCVNQAEKDWSVRTLSARMVHAPVMGNHCAIGILVETNNPNKAGKYGGMGRGYFQVWNLHWTASGILNAPFMDWSAIDWPPI
jgi:hypothetical protein